MSFDVNLAPCRVNSQKALWFAVAVFVFATVAAVWLEMVAQRRSADLLGTPVITSENGPLPISEKAQRGLNQLSGLSLGEGSGAMVLLSRLESDLPARVSIRHFQYDVSKGETTIELESTLSSALAEAVSTIESKYMKVRVISRQAEEQGKTDRIAIRLSLIDGVPQ